ncbi:MAG TPA: response regulator [Pseudomonadales bacterium]|nr:response regulator [Pseudomonadales bacterium]
MKYKSNLRSRIALFTLLPAVLCSLLIGSYLAYALVRDINQYEEEISSTYAEQISAQAFAPMAAGQTDSLQTIAQLALEYSLIRSISFYDSNQQLLAHAGPRHQAIIDTKIIPFSPKTVSINTPVYRQIFVPVTKSHLALTASSNKNSNKQYEPQQTIGWVQIEFSRTFIALHKYRTILIDIIIVATILAVGFWFSSPFSDRLVGSLQEIAKATTSIRNGNGDVQLPESDIIELQDLCKSITDMRDAIDEQQSDLQHHIEQSTRDLRETLETIEIQNIELDLARKEAVQASRVKSEFLANTSHEIRTPLNSIIGFSRLLLKTPLSSQQQDYLQNIRKSSENLLTIINDVLDLSKIEAGKLVLDYVPFDIHEVLAEILQILAPGAHEKGIELLHMIYSDVPRQLLGDPLRLKQVLTNLISNAIKFSEQGNIVVRIAQENTDSQQVLLNIEVNDSGKGLPNNDNSIFNAFSQLDSSSTREYSGTGLGLAISKKLVEQMGGDIGYRSEPGNTTFWFTVRFDIANMTESTPGRLQAADSHILLYDREPLCRRALSHSLTDWGIQPVLADSIEQIIPSLARYAGSEHSIDALIIGLPVKHTTQEFEQIQQCIARVSQNYRCPVIFCTPMSARHRLPEDLQKSVIHLSKPVTERRLQQALHTAMGITDIPVDTNITTRKRPENASNIKVMSVDDNPSNLKLISAMMRDCGFTVFEAQSGQEALAIFQTEAIDIIFMDIQMPFMDGIETSKKIRQMESTSGKRTPIIALTAHALAEQRQRLLMSGLDDYLSKPATDQQLLRMVAKWLETPEPELPGDQFTSTEKNIIDDDIFYCVDRTVALKASGNNPAIATEMLNILLDSLPNEQKVINEAIKAGNYALAGEYVHKLHGACCYCGVIELKNCCNAMETLIKKNLIEHMDDVMAAFNRAVGKLLLWKKSNSPEVFFRQGNIPGRNSFP